MNEFELPLVIEFLEKTRRPFRDVSFAAEERRGMAYHNLSDKVAYPQPVRCDLDTGAGIRPPYATSMRLINRMLEQGNIVKKAKGPPARVSLFSPAMN